MIKDEQKQPLSKMLDHLLAASKIDMAMVTKGLMPMNTSLNEARSGLGAAIAGLKSILRK